MAFHVPNYWRLREGPMGSDDSIGNNGAFLIYHEGNAFKVIASDQMGWEHVSVSIDGSTKPPRWKDMCDIKDMFWDADDCVIQFHPPKKDYVNNHPGCLHLWRPIDQEVPRPPRWMVGV